MYLVNLTLKSDIMKKQIIISVLLGLSFFLISLIGHSQSYVLSNSAKDFTINFPAEPEYSLENTDTDVGVIAMHMYSYALSEDMVYMVMYSDFPDGMMDGQDPQDILSGAKEGLVSDFEDMEVLNNDVISVQGNPGRFYKSKNDDLVVLDKMVLVGNRLYQIMILTYYSDISEIHLQSFVNTFLLLN